MSTLSGRAPGRVAASVYPLLVTGVDFVANTAREMRRDANKNDMFPCVTCKPLEIPLYCWEKQGDTVAFVRVF